MDDLNGDLTIRVAVDTSGRPWTPSPSGTVFRKRVHRVGPPESGQVTSVVRYEPAAKFPAHDHPEGEEILVLDGVFSDEHGDWPAGTYLVNPEGFRHAPFSRDGCELFVKLRQLPGTDRQHVALQTREIPWQPGRHPGLEEKLLYSADAYPERVVLEKWSPEFAAPRTFAAGAEVFVLDGQFADSADCFERGAWLRVPPGGRVEPVPGASCILYLKCGGVSSLRSSEQ